MQTFEKCQPLYEYPINLIKSIDSLTYKELEQEDQKKK